MPELNPTGYQEKFTHDNRPSCCRGGFSTYGSVSHVFQPRLGPGERGTALLARLVLVHVSGKLTEERGGLWSSGCPNPARIRIRRPDRRDR
jgi:hypothetical protein